MDFQSVSLFSGYCPIFKENRQIPIYYYDNIGKLSGRKYMDYQPCEDCSLTHNAFNLEECCPIYTSKLN